MEPPESVFGGMLALLPDEDALRRQVLFGDLERLRAAYPEAAAFGEALTGVWLSDALVGANGPLWRKQYGFGLGRVDRFVSGGFHPREAAVALGRFKPAKVQATLEKHGYKRRGELMAKGKDGSVDVETPVGRLALSSLDRIAVEADRLVAASTTALAKATLAPAATLAGHEDLVLAARALADVTSAIVLPPELVRPPSGVPVEILATEPASLVAAGLDDQGPESRTVKVVLVYDGAAEAEADAQVFRERLAATPLTGEQAEETFGDLLGDLAVEVVGRVVVVTGLLAPEAIPGAWRGLLERGDLAVLVRQQPA